MSPVETYPVELEVAEEVLKFLPGHAAEVESEDEKTIRFRIREKVSGWRLVSVIFSRDSLRRLARDGQRRIKIEYLQRDIARVAARRLVYVYPHPIRQR